MAVGKDDKMTTHVANGVEEDKDKEKTAAAEKDADMSPRYKKSDRVYAQWMGNGCWYAATVAEVDNDKRTLKVTWDDNDESHRDVSFDQVQTGEMDHPKPWSMSRIERKAVVKDSEDKGRCLFTREAVEPGGIVFVEAPTLVALPGDNQKLWDHLQKLHEGTPLQLGTITFHFAALLTQLTRDEVKIKIVVDKFVPDPDEEAGDDVTRILASLQESMADELKLKDHPICPKQLQRLVSAWRYNSFGHHKEDGLVLYNRISMCAHSCDPTCCWSYGEEDSFVLRARVNLKAGGELTISYLQDEDLLKGTIVRRNKLQNWRFTCGCIRCNLKIDLGRGFRCRKCRVGIVYPDDTGALIPCSVCGFTQTEEDQRMLTQLEDQYVTRVDALDKRDVADVETVYQAALDIFERHWILYVMDTMLWEAHRQERLNEAIEHQQRRIDFHTHYYPRPTFILAWCHEEMGDSQLSLFRSRKWKPSQEFMRAYHMLVILCGQSHQYTASPYQKYYQVTQMPDKPPASNANAATTSTSDSKSN
eukprot:TRINITY_DN8282_c0_g1_i1.p1 TRINITY_DN8282_c0_g1~~TRINITY_DN8282_c0_g1_i1.p1  ORF type:complete len:532 (-),score=122.72 TRINITY_DN8282_c0_g1_i1:214-1809(-)